MTLNFRTFPINILSERAGKIVKTYRVKKLQSIPEYLLTLNLDKNKNKQ